MEEGGLTQDEIDALLSVYEELLEEEAKTMDDGERDSFTSMITKAINAGCETLTTMIGRNTAASHVAVESTTPDSIADRFEEMFASITCPITLKKKFIHLMAIPMPLASYMAEQMVNPGADSAPADLSDMGQSAYESLMETFCGTMVTTLSVESSKTIASGGPNYLRGTMAGIKDELAKMAGSENLAVVQYDLSVEGAETTRAMSILSAAAVKALTEAPPLAPPAPKAAAEAAAPAPAGGGGGRVAVTAPVFTLPEGVDANLGRLLDIPLKITVVLGKTRLEIEKIMDLGSGSIVELDQVHGEPVSILVNGRLFAKGEVVVVEENFGVRISHIITPEERLSLLQ